MRVLDTDILVGILRKNEDAVRKYEETEEEMTTTVLNAQELLFGALISENPEENLSAAKGLINELNILVYDKKGMMESVKIQAYLEKAGKHIGFMDEMISGICLANNGLLITRNVKHFSRIANLKIEKW